MNRAILNDPEALAIVGDPAARDWLKRAVIDLSTRDPVDVLTDTAALAAWARARAARALQGTLAFGDELELRR